MSELETSKSVFESLLGNVMEGSGGSAADPPGGMNEWWKTPASLVGPPAVDPAIYGIDASDVGGTVVDDVAASVAAKHHRPSDLNGFIGMSNAASAQAGAPSRTTLIQQADGDRGLAMNAQLQLAARTLESVTDKIYLALNAVPDERGSGGVLQQLEALVAEGVQARNKLNLVSNEKFLSSAMKDGMLHVSRATHKFWLATEEVKKYARDHQLSVSPKTTAAGVKRDTLHLETSMQMVGADTTNVGKVKDSEDKLENESLRESLDGLLHSSQALMMAVHEAAPEIAVKEVLPSLGSSHRMLDASLIDGIKPTAAMKKQGAEIVRLVETAFKTAGPQLRVSLESANAGIPRSIARLEQLAKAKK